MAERWSSWRQALGAIPAGLGAEPSPASLGRAAVLQSRPPDRRVRADVPPAAIRTALAVPLEGHRNAVSHSSRPLPGPHQAQAPTGGRRSCRRPRPGGARCCSSPGPRHVVEPVAKRRPVARLDGVAEVGETSCHSQKPLTGWPCGSRSLPAADADHVEAVRAGFERADRPKVRRGSRPRPRAR